MQHFKVQIYLLPVALNVRHSVFNAWFPTEFERHGLATEISAGS